jgi:hypothetical protein
VSVGCAVGLTLTVVIGFRWRATIWDRRRPQPASTAPQQV